MKPSSAPDAPLRVLYVGRLSPEKGVDVLLRAWSIFLHPSPLSGAEQTAPSDPPPSERGGAQSASTDKPPSERGMARRASTDKPPSERGVARSAGGSTPTSTASANHSSLFTLHSSLTIVGDGPERPMLESLATTLGIADRVEFTGALSRPSALAALAAASLLVFPSIWYEQFAITPLEAMALGVPVLVSDVARFGTIVENGVTGHFFTSGDPVALAAALRELLADPDSLRSMGEAARAAFEASDSIPCRNLARLERVYASCLHDA